MFGLPPLAEQGLENLAEGVVARCYRPVLHLLHCAATCTSATTSSTSPATATPTSASATTAQVRSAREATPAGAGGGGAKGGSRLMFKRKIGEFSEKQYQNDAWRGAKGGGGGGEVGAPELARVPT